MHSTIKTISRISRLASLLTSPELEVDLKNKQVRSPVGIPLEDLRNKVLDLSDKKTLTRMGIKPDKPFIPQQDFLSFYS